MARLLLVAAVLACAAAAVSGHGYLLEPPGRSSMWRKGFHTPRNPDDNGYNCGGKGHQWGVNHGKCGICGDAWDGPRENEAGGKYATGTMAATYRRGQVINATAVVTANHLGYFEFRLCPNNNVHKPASQACLDQHVLPLADGSGSKLHIGRSTGAVHTQLRLPPHVTCAQCVLQWRYHTGNSWGVCEHGGGALGCGPQEEFYSCADVRIV